MKRENNIQPFALLKLIEQSEDDIRAGRVMEQDEVFAEIAAQLDSESRHTRHQL